MCLRILKPRFPTLPRWIENKMIPAPIGRRVISFWRWQFLEQSTTLQGINISHLRKRKIIFKMPFLGDMLVPWRVVSSRFWIFSVSLVKVQVLPQMCSSSSLKPYSKLVKKQRWLKLRHVSKLQWWPNIFLKPFTPPKTNMEPENEPWKRRFELKTIIFRFHVSFPGCTYTILRHFWMCHVMCYHLPTPRPRSKELGHWEKESRCSLSQNGPLPTRHRFFEKKTGRKKQTETHVFFFFGIQKYIWVFP